MQDGIKTACVQFTIKVGDFDANLTYVRAALERLAADGTQLVVLPEMWGCGFAYRSLRKLASCTEEVVAELAAVSERYGMVIVGTLPEPHGEKVYNTAFVVDRGEVVGSYRKMHLFSLMGEDLAFDPGDSFLVAQTSAGRIGVLICYDLRFPELARRLTLEGAQILVVPGQWPGARSEHWRTLIHARAIENQLFLAAANCCGTVGKLHFSGDSMIVGPRGELLAHAGGESCEACAILDPVQMERFRGEIGCLNDRRPECY